MKHILFIIGSFRKESFNRQLAEIAEDILKDKFEISYLDFNDIPYMNQDLEKLQNLKTTSQHGVFTSINNIRQEILKADGIWIFTPEYNHSYPGLLKNLFDWLSRPMDISNFANPTAVQGKKVTASGAGGKNKTASCRAKLNDLLEYIKMDVMKEPQTGIALGMEAWVKGEFKLTEEQLNELKTQADKFAEFVG
ncbi:MAG: NAD(P)H-dependent oxidoreductase [Bacteroidales bacterium]|nr:NAD(P)H-dependent oxidoreductase [Bacteroidales bacterium]MBR5782383.1 NAD(P)H-dependent oxidoreductase [Bacteroidales bacterium]